MRLMKLSKVKELLVKLSIKLFVEALESYIPKFTKNMDMYKSINNMQTWNNVDQGTN